MGRTYKKPIKSGLREDFAKGLKNIMAEEGAEFAEGTLEDNMVDIYDNYVSQFYEDELNEDGGEAVAEDWFRNTYYEDEEGIFKHDEIDSSRKVIKSELENNPYGFKLKDDIFVYDKFGNHWTIDTWVYETGYPFEDYGEAVGSMHEALNQSGIDDELEAKGVDIDDYCASFTDFVNEVCPNYIKSSRKRKWKHPDEKAKDEGADITCSRKSIKSGIVNLKPSEVKVVKKAIKDSGREDEFPNTLRQLERGGGDLDIRPEERKKICEILDDETICKKFNISNSHKPIKSALNYDDIDVAAAVAAGLPMASPSTQDAVGEWILTLDPEEEGFETEEDIEAFVYNWTDHFANDNWNDEESIRDLVGCGYLDDSWLEDFDDEIESACGSKGKKKKGKKEIKSSLNKEDHDLYLQFRDDLYNAIVEVFKKYNMSGRGPLATKEDFDLVMEWMDAHNSWDEDDEIESSRKAIKSSYVDCFGKECKVVKPKFVDDNDLTFVDWVIDNDIVQYSVYRDDDDNYYAVEGEY